jgi:hypothetical protein
MVAIIISGQLRNFEECYASLKSNILDHNPHHIYMHTYLESPALTTAIELFKPYKLLLEQPDQRFEVCQECLGSIPDRASMYWQHQHWKTIFALVPPDRYKYVLKVRYDLKYAKPVVLADFDPAEFNIPEGGDFLNGLSDLIAFSSYSNMAHYCQLIDYIAIYTKVARLPCHPETLLRYHLHDYPVKRWNFPLYLREVCMTDLWR